MQSAAAAKGVAPKPTRKQAVDEIADIFASHLATLPTAERERRLKALAHSVKRIRVARSENESGSSSTHLNQAQSQNRA